MQLFKICFADLKLLALMSFTSSCIKIRLNMTKKKQLE